MLAVLGLSVAAALWLLWFTTLHPGWRGRRSLMGLFYAGLMLLTAALVALAPWYGFFAFLGYPQAFAVLHGGWRYVGAASTGIVQGAAFLGGATGIAADHLWWEWAGVSAVSAVISAGFFFFAEQVVRRSGRQTEALAQVHEANTRLERAMARNADLQAQLLAQARTAGVMDERQRMAGEIHDTLAQGLAGILAQLQAADQRLDDEPALRRHLSNATELARESLVEARRTVHAVEPTALTRAALPEAIRELTARWSAGAHVDVDLTTTGTPRPMHTDVEAALLRTTQEALANVAKHARARRVGLTLSYMEDVVTLDVRDDGIGFEPGAPRGAGSLSGGFGLIGMRQRVQRLAGRLEIESEPGGGTAISATVPAIPAVALP
jgi:signal transduction histidine kinase